jgi:hypothetical protein
LTVKFVRQLWQLRAAPRNQHEIVMIVSKDLRKSVTDAADAPVIKAVLVEAHKMWGPSMA